MTTIHEVLCGADLSPDRIYRWRLWRTWDPALPHVCWIMLNPSTADASEDDPTIRRCVGFAKEWSRWGHMPTFGGIVVVNLFALRSTDPKALITSRDPVGRGNDETIIACARGGGLVVAAWGAHGIRGGRADSVRRLLRREGIALHHLGLTKAGQPKHPLYLRGDTQPIRWEAP